MELPMRYLLAILLPPVAVLLCGKPILAALNLALTLLFWIPGIIHALFVVSAHQADVRADRQARRFAQVQVQTHAKR